MNTSPAKMTWDLMKAGHKKSLQKILSDDFTEDCLTKCEICSDSLRISQLKQHLQRAHDHKLEEYLIEYGAPQFWLSGIVKEGRVQEQVTICHKCRLCGDEICMMKPMVSEHLWRKHQTSFKMYVKRHLQKDGKMTCYGDNENVADKKVTWEGDGLMNNRTIGKRDIIGHFNSQLELQKPNFVDENLKESHEADLDHRPRLITLVKKKRKSEEEEDNEDNSINTKKKRKIVKYKCDSSDEEKTIIVKMPARNPVVRLKLLKLDQTVLATIENSNCGATTIMKELPKPTVDSTLPKVFSNDYKDACEVRCAECGVSVSLLY